MPAPPERPSTAALVEALSVRRHAVRGLAVGVLLAAVVYVYRVVVVGDVPHTVDSPILFLGLAFVLAVTTALFVTLVLVTLTARRLVRETAAGSGEQSEVESGEQS